jgi:hypothetical protein
MTLKEKQITFFYLFSLLAQLPVRFMVVLFLGIITDSARGWTETNNNHLVGLILEAYYGIFHFTPYIFFMIFWFICPALLYNRRFTLVWKISIFWLSSEVLYFLLGLIIVKILY